MKKKGAPGWVAAEARMYTRRGPLRLRVHVVCVLEGDEQLGLSALTGATCGRCRKKVVDEPAVMVQRTGRLDPEPVTTFGVSMKRSRKINALVDEATR